MNVARFVSMNLVALGGIAMLSWASPALAANLTGVTAVSLGNQFTCATVTGGVVKCWGGGYTSTGSTSLATVGDVVNVQTLSVGYDHSCIALPGTTFDVRGVTVKCWGDNSYDKLGGNFARGPAVSTPQQVLIPGVPGATSIDGVKTVATGTQHACAIMNDSTVRCWGNNASGQLGSSGVTQSGTALPVPNLSGVSALALGDSHSCALVSGSVKCWGAGRGNGSTADSTTPIPVAGISGATAIAAGYHFSCALLANGSIKCWGISTVGQLGVGSTISNFDYNPPVEVQGVSGATALAAGASHACAIVAAGDVMCWGDGRFGQVGNGKSSQVNASSQTNPPSLVAGVTGAKMIDLGPYHTCAVITGGRVKCWGENDKGQLGDGTTTQRSSPVDVSDPAASVTLVGLAADAAKLTATGNEVYVLPVLTAQYNEGSSKAVLATSWKSSNDVIPAPSGNVTLKAPVLSRETTAVWTATYTEGTVTKTVTLDVTVKPFLTPTALVISGDNKVSSDPSDGANLRDYVIKATLTDGSTSVVKATSWTSSKPDVASISANGSLKANPVSADTTVTLTAVYELNGVKVTADLMITITPSTAAPTLTSLALVCPPTAKYQQKFSCEAKATFSDGTSKIVANGQPGSNLVLSSQYMTLLFESGGQFQVIKQVTTDTKVTINASYTVFGTQGNESRGATATVNLLALDSLAGSERVMNWAEAKYPSYFAPAATTGQIAGYDYRAYKNGIYLGSKDGRIYVFGPPFGSSILDVGAVADFLKFAIADGF